MIGGINNVKISGKPVDDQTRCIHYHSESDIIAINFKCCDRFYPCYSCHKEVAGHEAKRWPKDQWDAKAILCGNCKHILTIAEYMGCDNQCPKCHALFNPNCQKHYPLYFEME